MMKKVLLIILVLGLGVNLFAQIDPELLLELNKGTTAEMNAVTPAKGVLLYNTDDDKVYRFDGTNWLAVGEDGDWTRTGNDQYSAVSGNVGIGTNNPQRLLHLSQDNPSSLTLLALENPNTTNGNSAIVSFRTKTTGVGGTDFMETAAITANYQNHDHANQATDLTFWTKEGSTWNSAILKSNGDFGLGTNTPKVHLNNNTSSIPADLEISTTGKTGIAGRTDLSLFSDLDGSNPTNIFLQGKLSNGKYGWATWSFRGNHALNEYKDWVDFGVSDGTATKEQMIRMNVLNGDVVFNEGNVGVKTATPRSDLDINGILIEGKATPSAGSNIAGKNGSCVVSHGIASFFTTTQDNNYMHIKLPYKVDVDNSMYHIKATGYRYRSSEVIDITWVGYCYSGSGSLIQESNINTGGSNFNITQYVGSDNHIYLRFRGTSGSNYYQSFRIDSMKVGNGEVLKEGDIQIISSASANL